MCAVKILYNNPRSTAKLVYYVGLLVWVFIGQWGGCLAMENAQEQLLASINVRFQLMEEVAKVKVAHQLPFFVPAQEEKVLAKVSEQAQALHLSPKDVCAFMRTQMAIGVNIQRRWQAHWKAEDAPQHIERNTLDERIRPQLEGMTQQILNQLGPVIAELKLTPDPKKRLRGQIGASINAPFVEDSDKEALLTSLYAMARR